MSLPCVLITPKRKLGGHLAVKKDVLHFFGEFLVEGTGGSSVFKNFNSSNSDGSKPEDLGGSLSQRIVKFPIDATLDSERNHSVSIDGMINKKSKKIKRHRRWNISKVEISHMSIYIIFDFISFCSYTLFIARLSG